MIFVTGRRSMLPVVSSLSMMLISPKIHFRPPSLQQKPEQAKRSLLRIDRCRQFSAGPHKSCPASLSAERSWRFAANALLCRYLLQIAARRPGKAEDQRRAGWRIGRHGGARRPVSGQPCQQAIEFAVVLEAAEVSHCFDKAEELPPGSCRKLHPWQLFPTDGTRRSGRVSPGLAW